MAPHSTSTSSLVVAAMTFVGLLASTAQAQTAIYPSPTDIIGTGPDPPAITGSASGSWVAPTASVTLSNGVVVPPASETGLGRQAHVRGPNDFCLFMPPNPTTENLVDAEADAVAYCFNAVNNTRPMPDGFVQTSHFRVTDHYVQVSGTYNWLKMNLNPYDCGGEYDNHGPAGVGNPVGAHIDGGQDFFQFLGGCDTPGVGQFVIRSCNGPSSYEYCKNTFDLMGALWVAPGDYQQPGFVSCQADSDLPVGVYNSSYTFAQGQPSSPPPVPAPSSSMVSTFSPLKRSVSVLNPILSDAGLWQCSTTVSPAASGVTYSWAQLGYAQAISSGAASPGASDASTAAPTTTAASASTTITSAPVSKTTTATAAAAATTTTTRSSAATKQSVGVAVAFGIVALTFTLVA